ncbi:MAG TPA: SGNH/GDSL hydrolase family protein [Solirubrobacterales bacterium]|nr:SGNH/GDSL hydrolase family protein [Solirubrobacterales bacterium]
MSRSSQSSPRRLRRTAVLAIAMLAVLAAFAGAARAANYVALGDSYAAGPIIPNQIAPFGCLKSDHNYAHLAAPAIGLPLRDPSCSGAKTADMTNPQQTELETNPPQFNSLDAETTRVSLTIGGNDIGFSEIALSCVTVNPFSTPCKDKYDSGGKDQIAERIAATAPKVAAVLQGIHSRSPAARVFVVNYAAIFPETGFGCWPQMPIGFGDVPYLRSKEKELNAMLATQAASNGATLVNWYQASIGHDACKGPLTRWVEPVVPTNPAAPIHPNLAGMQGAANILAAVAE